MGEKSRELEESRTEADLGNKDQTIHPQKRHHQEAKTHCKRGGTESGKCWSERGIRKIEKRPQRPKQ